MQNGCDFCEIRQLTYYVNWTFSKIWHFDKIDLWFAHHCQRYSPIVYFRLVCNSTHISLRDAVYLQHGGSNYWRHCHLVYSVRNDGRHCAGTTWDWGWNDWTDWCHQAFPTKAVSDGANAANATFFVAAVCSTTGNQRKFGLPIISLMYKICVVKNPKVRRVNDGCWPNVTDNLNETVCNGDVFSFGYISHLWPMNLDANFQQMRICAPLGGTQATMPTFRDKYMLL